MEDKKWFVYVGDHHEGPFTPAEIRAKMDAGQVSADGFVWCEGMPDWSPLPEVAELRDQLGGVAAPPSPPISPPAAAFGAPEPEAPSLQFIIDSGDSGDSGNAGAGGKSWTAATPAASLATEPELDMPPAEARDPHAAQPATPLMTLRSDAPTEMPLELETAAKPSAAAPTRVRARVRLGAIVKPLVFLAVIGAMAAAYQRGLLAPALDSPAVKTAGNVAMDAAQPYLLKLAEKVPALGRWISPIPRLEDVAPADLEELKAAAGARLAEGGPRVAFVQSQADPVTPSFYVSSNLPDGARFDFYLEGVPETLLNQLSANTRAQATLAKKLGKTEPVRASDGKPLVRGEYVVYAYESDAQPPEAKAALQGAPASAVTLPEGLPRGLKLVAKKTLFLGGPNDTPYAARLKEFHDKLRDKAAAELQELKQFYSTLNDIQLNGTVTTFNLLHEGKMNKAKRAKWAAFHAQWETLHGQLAQSFDKWTPEALSNDFFYGSLYGLAQAAGKAVGQVHELHQAYFAAPKPTPDFDARLGEAVIAAQTALQQLHAKLDQADKLTPTPNGMPRKEGL